MEHFQTLAAAIIDLQNRGFDQDFILGNENIYCIQLGDTIPPDDFEVIEAHRFESKNKRKKTI